MIAKRVQQDDGDLRSRSERVARENPERYMI